MNFLSVVFVEDAAVNSRSSVSSIPNENPKAGTVERVETNEQPPSPPPPSEPSVDANKGEKRPPDEPFDEEDVPVLERINKRAKMAEKENNGRANGLDSEKVQKKRTIKLTSLKTSRKRILPSTRTNKESKATWVRKYSIEDCCIRLNQYDSIYDNGTE